MINWFYLTRISLQGRAQSERCLKGHTTVATTKWISITLNLGCNSHKKTLFWKWPRIMQSSSTQSLQGTCLQSSQKEGESQRWIIRVHQQCISLQIKTIRIWVISTGSIASRWMSQLSRSKIWSRDLFTSATSKRIAWETPSKRRA